MNFIFYEFTLRSRQCRLSRSGRIIENSFGILAARWRIFRSPIIALPINIEHFTRACIVLHNFLMYNNKEDYSSHGFGDYIAEDGRLVQGAWRREEACHNLTSISPAEGMRCTNKAQEIRNQLKNYYSTTGSVPWQLECVTYNGRMNDDEGLN